MFVLRVVKALGHWGTAHSPYLVFRIAPFFLTPTNPSETESGALTNAPELSWGLGMGECYGDHEGFTSPPDEMEANRVGPDPSAFIT